MSLTRIGRGLQVFFVALSHDNIAYKVVSTIVSEVHFSRFPTVEPNSKGLSFLSLTSLLFKKIPVETESSLSKGRTIIFITLVGKNYYR